ncbi:MAG TPA: peptidylprolyl isomerase [Mycobacterium sp.]|nr:peptidylprolyl isomerase [Mycobacterium sp.]HQC76839.1 peptidylprolyl isomerase [Mycobacterium sp.]
MSVPPYQDPAYSEPTTPPYGQPAGGTAYPEYPPYPPPMPYPYLPGYPPYRPPPTNALAIAALICAFLFAPLGIVFGHLSLSQIKKSGEEGRSMAVAGLVISYIVTIGTILALIAGALFISWAARVVKENTYPDGVGVLRPHASGPRNPGSLTGGGDLPAFNPPAALGAACAYPATATRGVRPVVPPTPGPAPTEPATQMATMVTNEGPVLLDLDLAKAPCTVKSFLTLAQQGFYDKTDCHRLTDSPKMAVLQCGDPTSTGIGGPGYRFANEYPTNQYRQLDPALGQPVTYPRGTLAMANSGPDSNGSQFFIVYRDSKLPPTYTVFGQVRQVSMEIVDQLVSVGVADGNDDGKPAEPITVTSIRP